jgi:hypothetical protein
MSLPSNGITPEVIREMMPPYQLSADLLAAAFAAVPAPPPGATQAWRVERATRLVQEIAGLMPADAPQARIAAEIVIVREAADDTFAWANAPGLTVDQVCRLRRTAGGLTVSAAALELTLARHQQRPVPFFGTVLVDGVDVAALAAGWGGQGSRRDDAGMLGGGGGSADGPVPVGMAGTSPAMTVKASPAMTVKASPAMTVKASPAVTIGVGPDCAEASGDCGESPDGPVAVGMAGTGPAMTRGRGPASASAPATERQGPPRPRRDADATLGVVTRLDQGPGWTLDVVRPRTGGDVAGADVAGADVAGGEVAVGAAPEPVA